MRSLVLCKCRKESANAKKRSFERKQKALKEKDADTLHTTQRFFCGFTSRDNEICAYAGSMHKVS